MEQNTASILQIQNSIENFEEKISNLDLQNQQKALQDLFVSVQLYSVEELDCFFSKNANYFLQLTQSRAHKLAANALQVLIMYTEKVREVRYDVEEAIKIVLTKLLVQGHQWLTMLSKELTQLIYRNYQASVNAALQETLHNEKSYKPLLASFQILFDLLNGGDAKGVNNSEKFLKDDIFLNITIAETKRLLEHQNQEVREEALHYLALLLRDKRTPGLCKSEIQQAVQGLRKAQQKKFVTLMSDEDYQESNNTQRDTEEKENMKQNTIATGFRQNMIQKPSIKEAKQQVEVPEQKAIHSQTQELHRIFNQKVMLLNYSDQRETLSNVLWLFRESAQNDELVFSLHWDFAIWFTRAVQLTTSIELFKEYLRKVKREFLKATHVQELVTQLVKGIAGETRENTINQRMGFECISDLFQMGFEQNIFNSINELLDEQSPKILLLTIQLLLDLLRNFGILKMRNLAPFFAQFELLMQSARAEIRAACYKFYREAYCWLGQTLLPYLKGLRTAQQEEVKRQLNSIELKEMLPVRCPQDVYNPLAVRIEIVQELREAMHQYSADVQQQIMYDQQCFTHPQQKLDVLERILQEGQQNGSITNTDVVLLKSLICDQNIFIAAQAAEICAVLATTLREEFVNAAKQLLPSIFYFIESKLYQAEIAIQAIVAMRYCVGFSLIVECAKPLLRSNFDDLRNFMLILLQKLVQEDSQEKIYGQHAAETAESVRQLVQDKNPDVRASALNLLACLKYIYSPDAVLEGIIGQLKERDVKQIQKNIEKFQFLERMRRIRAQKQQEEEQEEQQLKIEIVEKENRHYQYEQVVQPPQYEAVAREHVAGEEVDEI